MCSIRDRADEAHARYAAAKAELLGSISELARTEAWHGDAAGDLASWMAARWQESPKTARALVREAKAFEERPALREAMKAGQVSIDQAKALQILCEPGTDDDEVWLETLESWSISELEREARKKKAAELERKDDGIYFRMEHTYDERYMRGEFQLHPEDGAVLLGVISDLIPTGTRLRDMDRAYARALVELAHDVAGGGAHRGTTVLLTVQEEALRRAIDGEAVACVNGDGYVGIDTARRLACDATIETLLTDGEGKITGIGRTSRKIPPRIRRAVLERDGNCCTFPECSNDRFLELHHIVPWPEGGPTEIWNLQTTCWTHHVMVHEGGWSLRGEAGPKIAWIRPDGSPFEPRVRVVLDTS